MRLRHLSQIPLDGFDVRKEDDEPLYKTNLYGQTQPKPHSNYWVTIHTSGPNSVVVLEIAKSKDNVEIVGWRYAGEKQLKQLEEQAKREDGQLLILTSDKEAAAGLSTLPLSLSGGKDTKNIDTLQENLENLPLSKDLFERKMNIILNIGKNVLYLQLKSISLFYFNTCCNYSLCIKSIVK